MNKLKKQVDKSLMDDFIRTPRAVDMFVIEGQRVCIFAQLFKIDSV